MHRLISRLGVQPARALPRRSLACGLGTWALALALGTGLAQAGDTDPGRTVDQDAAIKAQRSIARERIAVERAGVEQRRSQQETACYQRFAVEDCLSEVRSRTRAAENALRRQEGEMNSAERRDKSADRLRAVEQKVEDKAQQAGPQPPVAGKLRAPRPDPAQPSSAPTPQDLIDTQAARAQQAQARALAKKRYAQSRSAAQQRKRSDAVEKRTAALQRYEKKQAQAHQDRERQRAKAQRNGKPKAAPLPPPADGATP